MLGEEANISKAQNSYGKHRCRSGRYKREGICALPGEVSYWTSSKNEKSAEVIVARAIRVKDRT